MTVDSDMRPIDEKFVAEAIANGTDIKVLKVMDKPDVPVIPIISMGDDYLENLKMMSRNSIKSNDERYLALKRAVSNFRDGFSFNDIMLLDLDIYKHGPNNSLINTDKIRSDIKRLVSTGLLRKIGVSRNMKYFNVY